MCAYTCFPEEIHLRNIKTQTIVKALVNFFTFVGLLKSVQSDQGSNFMSGVFQQVMHELGIKQYRSSTYHPESQGALEMFNQTLNGYCTIFQHALKSLEIIGIVLSSRMSKTARKNTKGLKSYMKFKF